MSKGIVALDFSQLSEFDKEMLELIETTYPKEAKKFVSRAGNAFRAEMKAGYKKHTIKRTGNLLRGVTRGRAYVYNGEDYRGSLQSDSSLSGAYLHHNSLFILCILQEDTSNRLELLFYRN